MSLGVQDMSPQRGQRSPRTCRLTTQAGLSPALSSGLGLVAAFACFNGHTHVPQHSKDVGRAQKR